MWELLANSYCVQAVAIVVGFVALVYGADWLVDGASAVAKRFGVSELVIGLTVVALGTSMPEFIVSLVAAIQGNTEIAITNILGSNTINTLVILGCSALICPIVSEVSCRRFDIPMSIAAGVLVLLLCLDGWIERWGGALMLLFFGAFMYHSIKGAKGANSANSADDSKGLTVSVGKAIALILLGLVLLVVGGEFVVRGATAMAHRLGVSDAIIGLTIVALGTSLPELATSCMAAFKKNVDLALGNVIGSNIFNVFFILGASALLRPLPSYTGIVVDAVLVILSSTMVLIFVHSNKQHAIQRWHGALMLVVYGAYLAYRVCCL